MALTALGRSLTEEHRRAQVGVAAQFAAGALILGDEVDPARIDANLPDAVGLLVAFTEMCRTDSTRLASAYVPAYRDAEGAPGGPLRGPLVFDAADTAARFALLAPMAKKRIGQGRAPRPAIEDALTRLVGSQMTTVLGGGRQVIDRSTLANPESVGWRRVSDGRPCAFCGMLVTRGPAYTSAANAGQGRKYHPRCGCTVEEVFGEWLPIGHERALLEAYAQADGSGTAARLAAIRAHGDVSDAHKGNRAAGAAGGSGGGRRRPPPAAASDDDGDKARRDLSAISPQVTERAQRHILDGDRDGGGHRHGVVAPATDRKIWFPESWSDVDCLAAVREVIASPKVVRWVGGRFINVYGEVNGVRIKVRVMPDGTVATAHPIDGAGVVVAHTRADGSVRLRDAPYGRSREVSW